MTEHEIPAELVVLCTAQIDPRSEEALMLPPDHVIHLVRRWSVGEPVLAEIQEWINEQQGWQEKAVEVLAALPPLSPTEAPGWLGSQWSLVLRFPWSDGLAGAVVEGLEWLARR